MATQFIFNEHPAISIVKLKADVFLGFRKPVNQTVLSVPNITDVNSALSRTFLVASGPGTAVFKFSIYFLKTKKFKIWSSCLCLFYILL